MDILIAPSCCYLAAGMNDKGSSDGGGREVPTAGDADKCVLQDGWSGVDREHQKSSEQPNQ
jgi:hypothetical protein